MTRDQLIAIIYRTHAAPYGAHITPALRQQLTISAGLAADAVLAQLEPQRAKRVEAACARFQEITETPIQERPSLKERIRTRVLQEAG